MQLQTTDNLHNLVAITITYAEKIDKILCENRPKRNRFDLSNIYIVTFRKLASDNIAFSLLTLH